MGGDTPSEVRWIGVTMGSRTGSAMARIGAILLLVLSATVTPSVVPAQAAVPAPTSQTSVVTVKVGADRTTITAFGVTKLAGVELELVNGAGVRVGSTCVSDADGDCNFVVTGTAVGGPNYQQRFTVRLVSVPAGWYANPSISVGVETSATATAYQFLTPALVAGRTYRSTPANQSETTSADFMFAAGDVTAGSRYTATTGIWQVSRANPVLGEACGRDVALVFDLSSSITNADFAAYKLAANTFIDSLVGSNSRIALYTFSTGAPARAGDTLALTSVTTPAGATTVKNRINSFQRVDFTNWDAGLRQVAASTQAFDMAIMMTDGSPTAELTSRIHNTPNNTARFMEVEYGIYSANAIKAEGTRVVAVGLGSYAPRPNLVAISGPDEGSDYFYNTPYASLAATLTQAVLSDCQSTIRVVKNVVPASTTGEDITGASPAAGFAFDLAATQPGVGLSTDRLVTGLDGIGRSGGVPDVTVDFTALATTPVATVGITEDPLPNFSLVTQGGLPASCTDDETGGSVMVTPDAGDPLGFSVDVSPLDRVTCVVYNRPDPSFLTLLKIVQSPNGGTGTIADFPLRAESTSATIEGVAGSPGVTHVQVPSGIYGLAETNPGGLPYELTDLDCATLGGVGVPITIGQITTVPVTPGADIVCTFTNTDVPPEPSFLTLVKQIATPNGWSATVEDFPLTAATAEAQVQGISGTPAVDRIQIPAGVWDLSETNPGALPFELTDLSCTTPGGPLPTSVDDPSVTIQPGDDVTCVFTNTDNAPGPSYLTLVKSVESPNGGTAGIADFPLAAAGPGTSLEGVSGDASVTAVLVPAGTYELSETNPDALPYELTGLTCADGALTLPTTVAEPAVDVEPGSDIVCTFVNTDTPARLTLQKVVSSPGGGTATTADFPLHAESGTTSVDGISGDTAVTAVVVPAGPFDLSETNPNALPYDLASLECSSDGAVAAATIENPAVAVAPGDDMVCVFTNSDTFTPGPDPDPDPDPDPEADPIANTGTDAATPFGAALGLLMAGAALLVLLRARRGAGGGPRAPRSD